jgi:Mg-chelatase subunit ChlD
MAGCDIKFPGGDDTGGGGQCLDDFLADLAMDRGGLEAEAAARGIDASDLIEELVSTGLDVADFLFDCSAREGVAGLGEGSGGTFYEADSSDDMVDTLIAVTEQDAEKSQDIVFLIDATGSMANDIDAVRTRLEEVVAALDVDEDRASFAWFRDRRVDSPWYDRNNSGLMKPNAGELESFLSGVSASGGGDLPESLYDATYKAVNETDWTAEKRLVIAVTDAGPHEDDIHSVEEVLELCEEQGVVVVPILVGF